MIILADEEIRRLIEETKDVPSGLRPLPALAERNQHRRRDYDVTTALGHRFVIAIRESMINTFDFSAILGYKLPEVNTVFRLRRYNGKSHYHTNTIENERFREFHVHEATARYQDNGSKEDHFARIDKRYFNLDGAIDCLLNDCGFRSPMADSPIFTGRME